MIKIVTTKYIDDLLAQIKSRDDIINEQEVLIANSIKLSGAEIQSNHNRVRWAESLIVQIPEPHDGRNSWLLNYGVREEAHAIRGRIGVERDKEMIWIDETDCLASSNYH